MGGDLIGSALVPISTGIDFVKAVIQVAFNEEPDLVPKDLPKASAVRFIFDKNDMMALEDLKREHSEFLVEYMINELSETPILDSSTRSGYFLMQANNGADLRKYLPVSVKE